MDHPLTNRNSIINNSSQLFIAANIITVINTIVLIYGCNHLRRCRRDTTRVGTVKCDSRCGQYKRCNQQNAHRNERIKGLNSGSSPAYSALRPGCCGEVRSSLSIVLFVWFCVVLVIMSPWVHIFFLSLSFWSHLARYNWIDRRVIELLNWESLGLVHPFACRHLNLRICIWEVTLHFHYRSPSVAVSAARLLVRCCLWLCGSSDAQCNWHCADYVLAELLHAS